MASLLQQDWDSPEAAAKAIISAVDERRFENDNLWVIVRPSLGLFYGPYPTQGAARKAAAKAVSVFDHPEVVRLARLFRKIEE